MRKPKASVNWEEAKLYFLHLTEEQNLLPPRQRLLRCFSDRRRFVTPVDLLAAKSVLAATLSARLNATGFTTKIILFESISVLFCVFQTSFGAQSYGKIVRLFNLPFRDDSSCSCQALNVNVVFSLFLFHERECMEKRSIESSPNTIYFSCLLGLLCRSKWSI